MILCAAISLRGDHPYDDAAERLMEMGLDGIMLGYDPNWSGTELEEARVAFESRGLIVAEVGYYCSIITPDEEVRRNNITKLKSAIKAADILGCHCVATISGSRDLRFHNAAHPDNWSAVAWQILIESCKEILEATENTGVKFCLEPTVRTNLNSVKALARIIEDVNHPNIGVVLDPVNLINIDTYYQTTSLLNPLFDILRSRIVSAHAKDTLIEPTRLVLHINEAAPGKGNLDYYTFLRRMDELPMDTPLIIEHLGSDDEVKEAADFIYSVSREIGVSLKQRHSF